MLDPTLSPSVARRALDAAVTGVVICDMTRPDYPMTYVNPAFERISGYRAREVLGRNCRILQGPDTDPTAVAALARAVRGGEECQVTLRNRRADGTPFWNEVSLAPVRDEDGVVVEYIGIQNDVTRRRDAEARVEHLALHDTLTGLANRHALQQALARATRHAHERHSGVALLYADIDAFKAINDSHGHAAGDELLRQFASRLERIVRPGDVLARQGGDEFLLLLDGLHHGAGAVAAAVARRIVATLERPFVVAGRTLHVRASVGASLYPRDAADADELLRHADQAMDRAKAREGSRWALFGTPFEAPPRAPAPRDGTGAAVPASREALAEAFDHLVRDGGLHARYQPLVELDTGAVVAYEALARGPQDGLLSRPDALFAYARRVGRLAELDWACRLAAVRGALDGDLPEGTRLFINVEPEAVGTPCPPHGETLWERARSLELTVEITERALTARPADLLRELEALRDRGCLIALDDVGADSRSLALLPALRPEVVKLDLRLIQERPDSKVAEIVAAVNAYAERTGAVVLAEGIETDEHLATARAIGATHGQGWSFGRPAPLAAFVGARRSTLRAPRVTPVPEGPSPYRVVERVLPVRQATKPLLVEISLHLERQAYDLGETALLVSAFQTAERFTPLTRQRYTRLASRCGFVAGLGVGLEPEPAPGVRGAAIGDGDVLTDEWSVVVLGPHFAAALVALDLGDTGPERTRRFDYALTYDRALVERAARSLMRRVQPLD